MGSSWQANYSLIGTLALYIWAVLLSWLSIPAQWATRLVAAHQPPLHANCNQAVVFPPPPLSNELLSQGVAPLTRHTDGKNVRPKSCDLKHGSLFKPQWICAWRVLVDNAQGAIIRERGPMDLWCWPHLQPRSHRQQLDGTLPMLLTVWFWLHPVLRYVRSCVDPPHGLGHSLRLPGIVVLGTTNFSRILWGHFWPMCAAGTT